MKMLLGTLAILHLYACAHTPKWTPQQRRALQMRTFEASYRNVFSAIKTVLQDDGYQIKSQDFSGGLIAATKNIDNSVKLFGIIPALLTDEDGKATRTTYEISFSLEKINKNNIETRLTLATYDSNNNASEVIKPEIYQSIYRNIQVEIKRRQAKGR
ncbi:MAG: hypothetical protein OYH77_00445 [Pseudomonadota bacterium]|nr:hypothetical protein [Pseudomonadota bacterium]